MKKEISTDWKPVQLSGSDFIPFVNITKNYGRAEFVVCSQYKRNKLVKMFFYPAQQGNVENYYFWEGVGRDGFSIGSFDGLDNPNIWLFSYCKEHKCQSFRMYVPNGSNFLYFDVLSSISIKFTKKRWGLK